MQYGLTSSQQPNNRPKGLLSAIGTSKTILEIQSSSLQSIARRGHWARWSFQTRTIVRCKILQYTQQQFSGTFLIQITIPKHQFVMLILEKRNARHLPFVLPILTLLPIRGHFLGDPVYFDCSGVLDNLLCRSISDDSELASDSACFAEKLNAKGIECCFVDFQPPSSTAVRLMRTYYIAVLLAIANLAYTFSI